MYKLSRTSESFKANCPSVHPSTHPSVAKHCCSTSKLASLVFLFVTTKQSYFRILLLVFKGLNGLAPSQLKDLSKHSFSSRTLTLNNQSFPEVQRAKLESRGELLQLLFLFSNNWPLHIRSTQTFEKTDLCLLSIDSTTLWTFIVLVLTLFLFVFTNL